ncbi:hypothetical protein G3N56_14450 [Desulfovibrio sulfodismutans]|uniref:Uncharacterized protein n=1 Tax=Desulfolutivibrio sulfodismutans TaxID=63561 RepID=A0A7K3NQ44_9BACT|nr:hypothetical protein [Desulfolutivibrio sulfodismutans]NDY57933.1 hypothetical protein [Desulfolutivibrio sulfodismutans]
MTSDARMGQDRPESGAEMDEERISRRQGEIKGPLTAVRQRPHADISRGR